MDERIVYIRLSISLSSSPYELYLFYLSICFSHYYFVVLVFNINGRMDCLSIRLSICPSFYLPFYLSSHLY